MKENTKLWLKCAGIRAIKTFFQTFVASIGTAAVLSEVNWQIVLSASALAAILSMATSLAGLPEVPNFPEDGDTIDEDPVESGERHGTL